VTSLSQLAISHCSPDADTFYLAVLESMGRRSLIREAQMKVQPAEQPEALEMVGEPARHHWSLWAWAAEVDFLGSQMVEEGQV